MAMSNNITFFFLNCSNPSYMPEIIAQEEIKRKQEIDLTIIHNHCYHKNKLLHNKKIFMPYQTPVHTYNTHGVTVTCTSCTGFWGPGF
jgi:S-methylmethionine-dependent homocysteine/selenocysteine methylase